jgi:hypothetical protein
VSLETGRWKLLIDEIILQERRRDQVVRMGRQKQSKKAGMGHWNRSSSSMFKEVSNRLLMMFKKS